jgi:hypothetical protein
MSEKSQDNDIMLLDDDALAAVSGGKSVTYEPIITQPGEPWPGDPIIIICFPPTYEEQAISR